MIKIKQIAFVFCVIVISYVHFGNQTDLNSFTAIHDALYNYTIVELF